MSFVVENDDCGLNATLNTSLDAEADRLPPVPPPRIPTEEDLIQVPQLRAEWAEEEPAEYGDGEIAEKRKYVKRLIIGLETDAFDNLNSKIGRMLHEVDCMNLAQLENLEFLLQAKINEECDFMFVEGLIETLGNVMGIPLMDPALGATMRKNKLLAKSVKSYLGAMLIQCPSLLKILGLVGQHIFQSITRTVDANTNAKPNDPHEPKKNEEPKW
jgi:hypothetical protein